jgi:signal transduction histidine kinase
MVVANGRYGRLAFVFLAGGAGALALTTARRYPDESFAGTSTLGALAELAAGWSLVTAGLLFSLRHRRNLFGPLLVGAGFAWFLPEWSNPRVGSAAAFALGSVGFVACAPLVAHAALAYPTGRLRSRLELVVVGISYAAAVLLLGLLPTSVFDPKTTGCGDCPRNLLLVRSDTSLFDTFNRYGLRIGIGALVALGLLILWRLARSSRSVIALLLPALMPAAAYIGLVAWEFEHSLGRGIISNEPFDQRLWRYEALALVLLAAAVVWELLRERRARNAVARLVVELGRAPLTGTVRDALARALDEPGLELLYRRASTTDYVDASGRPSEPDPKPGRAVTPLVVGGTEVAALVHDARLLEQPGLLQEVLAASRVAVHNEQLRAEVLAQLEELRASRARIVETSDSERRNLERDLHDGAQQRIVTLSLALQLLRSQLTPDAGDVAGPRINAAARKLQGALAELRELAHGIYPATLSAEGVAAAIEGLADRAPGVVEIESLPRERLPPEVENAAYFTVAEAIKGAQDASVRVERTDGSLLVRVTRRVGDAEDESRAWLVSVADRVGALGGSIELEERSVRAEIPCE